MPGANPPAPQPLNKLRHNKAAQTACAFMKAFHRFDPGSLSISDEGSKLINAANRFSRNLSIRDSFGPNECGKRLYSRLAAGDKQLPERVRYFGFGRTFEALFCSLVRFAIEFGRMAVDVNRSRGETGSILAETVSFVCRIFAEKKRASDWPRGRESLALTKIGVKETARSDRRS